MAKQPLNYFEWPGVIRLQKGHKVDTRLPGRCLRPRGYNRMIRGTRIGYAVFGLGALGVAITGCGGGDDGVTVVLSEWDVEVPDGIEAGSVAITADNVGGEPHELVIVRADSVDGWEQDDEGKVLEDQFAAADFLGEIEEFEAGGSESGTFDLTAGTYVFFCNIVEAEEDGSFESHFDEGMWTIVEVS